MYGLLCDLRRKCEEITAEVLVTALVHEYTTLPDQGCIHTHVNVHAHVATPCTCMYMYRQHTHVCVHVQDSL